MSYPGNVPWKLEHPATYPANARHPGWFLRAQRLRHQTPRCVGQLAESESMQADSSALQQLAAQSPRGEQSQIYRLVGDDAQAVQVKQAEAVRVEVVGTVVITDRRRSFCRDV